MKTIKELFDFFYDQNALDEDDHTSSALAFFHYANNH